MKITFNSGETLNVTAKAMEYGVRFPDTDRNDNTLHIKFYCTISNPATGAKMGLTWYDSHNNYMLGKDEIDEAMARLIVYAASSDASCYDCARDFDDFCAELGYDNDSRRALKIYRACKRISESWGRVSNGLSEETLDEIREY